jgi:uroporphyrin-III C-methyltransferase
MSVVFIGAGPGAADLITVRGARRLAQAEVVLHDALIDPALREHAPHARWVDVGKRGFCDSTGQARINALLVRFAEQGLRVVRLKGGDPSVFGRLEEELEALAQAGIECEVVPGITAALAAAAATQRPLTRRGAGRSVALTTAMTKNCELRAAHSADTEVFYWPAGSSAPSRAGCRTPAGRRTRRRLSSRAPASPTRSRATTAWPRSPKPRCCTAAGRRW